MGKEVGGRPLFLHFLGLHHVVLILLLFPFQSVTSKCILFNFGDSNSDTGALTAGLGLYLGPPAGRQFFHRTTGRFCDGRLYIDFLCESLKISYLSPYLESSGSDFTHGVNFAVAGAATEITGVPFPLSTQVLQFLHFKNRTRELLPQGKGSMISEKGFQHALYSFDMGQNDISIAFTANLTYVQVIEQIPSILSRIRTAIETIYENGGRKFLIYNTGPLGCLPQTLALRMKNDSEIDSFGCLAAYNNAAKAFNAGLSTLCDELRSEFENATVVYTDKYAIRIDLVANHTKYGFESPLMACCGHGGPPYNYKDRMTCGQPTATACPEGSRWTRCVFPLSSTHSDFDFDFDSKNKNRKASASSIERLGGPPTEAHTLQLLRMVKEEDYVLSDGASDDKLLDRTVSSVGSSGLKPFSGSVLVKEENVPSSSSGHLKSYFVGMGFSSDLVDRVIEENGDGDVNLLLEALFAYSACQKSSPEALDSPDDFSGSDKEDGNSPIEFSSDDDQEIEETDGPSNAKLDKKSYLLMMNFSEEEVDLAITRLGESAPLPELVDFIVTTQTAGCSGEKETGGSVNGENEETTTATLFGTMDKTLSLLQMGFTEDEVSTAIENFGSEVSISELADSIFAKRLAYRVDKEEDLSDYTGNVTWQNQNGIDCVEEFPKRSHPLSDEWITKASSSNGALYDYEDTKPLKKGKYMAVENNTASCSNYMQQERHVDWEPAFETKPNPSYGLENIVEERYAKEEIHEPSTPSLHRNVNGVLSRPPYFFYGNVVDVSQGTWRKLSQFLYAIEPEFVNSQFFSAFIRKEGYFHNLPTERRFHIVPKPPMTIEDALPHTKKWWPSWDTRKQLSCINSETSGVAQHCERLGRMMMGSQGVLSKEQQVDILHHCKRLNLIWVGQHKLSPIEPDHVERIFGYPRQHTEILGSPTDRLKALKYSFQTDTVGYHLSALKCMYPNGLRVLSIYTGIGGVEVALHRLGIRLKCVVSVEACEINRKILKRWWVNSGQSGVLKQVGGIEMLNIQTLESFMNQFGGFDIIIGGNPGGFVPGYSNKDDSVEMDLNLFFEFVRVFQRVRSIMGRNRRC